MHKQKAFTLLELLITSSITALLMLAITSLFISFLASAYKSRISQSLRESGNNTMIKIVEMIRNANEIGSYCNADYPLDYINLTGQDGLYTLIKVENNQIASISATNKSYLTESSASQNHISNLLFKCYPTPEGKNYVEVNFSLHTGSGEEDNSARSTSLDFSSGVATRN